MRQHLPSTYWVRGALLKTLIGFFCLFLGKSLWWLFYLKLTHSVVLILGRI